MTEKRDLIVDMKVTDSRHMIICNHVAYVIESRLLFSTLKSHTTRFLYGSYQMDYSAFPFHKGIVFNFPICFRFMFKTRKDPCVGVSMFKLSSLQEKIAT